MDQGQGNIHAAVGTWNPLSVAVGMIYIFVAMVVSRSEHIPVGGQEQTAVAVEDENGIEFAA